MDRWRLRGAQPRRLVGGRRVAGVRVRSRLRRPGELVAGAARLAAAGAPLVLHLLGAFAGASGAGRTAPRARLLQRCVRRGGVLVGVRHHADGGRGVDAGL